MSAPKNKEANTTKFPTCGKRPQKLRKYSPPAPTAEKGALSAQKKEARTRGEPQTHGKNQSDSCDKPLTYPQNFTNAVRLSSLRPAEDDLCNLVQYKYLTFAGKGRPNGSAPAADGRIIAPRFIRISLNHRSNKRYAEIIQKTQKNMQNPPKNGKINQKTA